MSADNWMIEVTFLLGALCGDEQMDKLSDEFDVLDWTVAQLPDGYLSVFGVSDGEEPLDAASRVIETSKQVLADMDIDGELEQVTICTKQWREREAHKPSLPELLATRDISKLLGVSRQRVSQLHHEHPQFPAPVVYTGAGPLWTRSAVDWFASMWDRRPGRRAGVPEETKNAGTEEAVVALRPRALERSSEHDTAREVCRAGVKA